MKYCEECKWYYKKYFDSGRCINPVIQMHKGYFEKRYYGPLVVNLRDSFDGGCGPDGKLWEGEE